MELLNQGTLPQADPYRNASDAITRKAIEYGRDALSSTGFGDLVLWMLDHGIPLPTPYKKPDPVPGLVAESFIGCIPDQKAWRHIYVQQDTGTSFIYKDVITRTLYQTSAVSGVAELTWQYIRDPYWNNLGYLEASGTISLEWTTLSGVYYYRVSTDGNVPSGSGLIPSSSYWFTNTLKSGRISVWPNIATSICDMQVPVGVWAWIDFQGYLFPNDRNLPILPTTLQPPFYDQDTPISQPPLPLGFVTYFTIAGKDFFPCISNIQKLSSAAAYNILSKTNLNRLYFPYPVELQNTDLLSRSVFGDIVPLWYITP
jgi:hypothetical protein